MTKHITDQETADIIVSLRLGEDVVLTDKTPGYIFRLQRRPLADPPVSGIEPAEPPEEILCVVLTVAIATGRDAAIESPLERPEEKVCGMLLHATWGHYDSGHRCGRDRYEGDALSKIVAVIVDDLDEIIEDAEEHRLAREAMIADREARYARAVAS